MKLEELEKLLKDSEYTILGHGTGRKGNGMEVVQSIFENGLRTKNNSLYYTTIGLDIPSIETLKSKLNNWEHCYSENIILIRVPNKYINMLGESSNLDCERFGAFMSEKVNDNGKIIYYLNPRYIIGSYNTLQDKVILNDKFEEHLSEESMIDLNTQYKKTLERTQARLKRFEELPMFDAIFNESEETKDDEEVEVDEYGFPISDLKRK